MKLFLSPQVGQVKNNSGIGQVIHAQAKYLPGLGFDLVDKPEEADLIAAHVTGDGLPRVDVLHCHGLYWTGDPGGDYKNWHHGINKRIAETARGALEITVPSAWVAEPFKRDMRITPVVIRHGVEVETWHVIPRAEKPFYVLWNKNRAGDVCDPGPVKALAEAQIYTVTTYAPEGFTSPYLRTLGSLEYAQMKAIVENASIYLATTQETYGIGTLEALAAGVPVLGYAQGGTLEIVAHGVNGYLVEPGDTKGLLEGVQYILAHYEAMSQQARGRALTLSWDEPMQAYAALYRQAYALRQAELRPQGVSVIITNYNYARYLPKAVASVEKQLGPNDEIIIVDDGSTDESGAVLDKYLGKPQFTILKQANQGVAAARNRGIAQARNPFYVCLDADDQLGAGFIEAGRAALSKNRAVGIAYAGLEFEEEGGGVGRVWKPQSFDFDFQTRIPDNPQEPPPTLIPTPSACMMRKSMWTRAGGYRQEYAPGEDTEFVTRALAHGFEAMPLPGVYTRYLLHAGSASKTKKYSPIWPYNPWMVDKQFPFAAPTKRALAVRSYEKPLVSVILPLGKGHEPYLNAVLFALAGQSLRSTEILLIDDTRGADLTPYLEPYPFVKVLKNPGKGVSSARNHGIAQARGDYLYFMDADDLPFPNALEKLFTGLVEANACYAYSSYYEIFPNGQRAELHPPEYEQGRLLDLNIHPITVLVDRKRAAQYGVKFDEQMKGLEDWDYFLQMAVNGLCGVKIKDVTAYIRRETGAFSKMPPETRNQLKSRVIARYKDYANGAKKFMACNCGAGGNAILAAKNLINPAPMPGRNQQIGGSFLMNTVRMEYTGPAQGAIPYKGVDPKRMYRASSLPLHRYHDVHPEDVQKLLDSGNFRIVDRVEAAPAPVMAPAQVQAPGIPPLTDLNDPRLEAVFGQASQPQAAPPPPAPLPNPQERIPKGDEPVIPSVTEMSVAEIQQAAPTAGKNILLAWKMEEEDGKKRKGALEAIDNALKGLVA